jgi:hypothetical protein
MAVGIRLFRISLSSTIVIRFILDRSVAMSIVVRPSRALRAVLLAHQAKHSINPDLEQHTTAA